MSNKGATKYSGKNFSILGDSISTLKGYNPEGYSVFYEGSNCEKSGVNGIEDTWWGQVINYFGGELLVNNSWSGSQVAKVPNQFGLFPSGCSDERTNGLHKDGKYPDVIIVYIGTNDWARAVQPEIKIVGWRNENTSTSDDPLTQKTIEPEVCGSTDETVFSIAYSEMIRKIAHNYPNAEIWCCTLNTTFMSNNPTFKFPLAYQGEHIETYNKIIISQKSSVSSRVHIIDLYSCHTPYDSIDGSHPTAEGMETIASLIINLVEKQISKENDQQKWASFSFVDENGKIHETYGYYENHKSGMKNDTYELENNISLDFKETEKIVIEYSNHHYEINTNNWEVQYKNVIFPADADGDYPQDFFDVKTVCLNRKVIKVIKKLFKSFFGNYTFQEKLKLLPPGATYEVYMQLIIHGKAFYYSNTYTKNFSVKSDQIPREIKGIVEFLDLYYDFIKKVETGLNNGYETFFKERLYQMCSYPSYNLMPKTESSEMEQQLSKFIENKSFSARHMNWGVESSFAHEWSETVWAIDYDGSVTYFIKYTDGMCSMPSMVKLGNDEMKELIKIFKKALKKHEKVYCCDGEGWEIISYDKKGNQNGYFGGYIYDILELERLSNYLYSIINNDLKR